jgi:hypothetical protein
MPVNAKPLVYLVLGAAGSGRRDIVLDLIEGGLERVDDVAVMLPAGEPARPIDAKLPGVTRWVWQDEVILGTRPEGAASIFFLVDGTKNPVEQIEQFKVWLDAQGVELARVLCVVDAQLAEKNPPLLAWYEACVHFSDIVLLNKREGVANKWMSEFLAHFKKAFHPCVFEMVKGGQVKNPALVLEPQARRMSHVFDEEQDWIFTNAEGEEIDEQEETAEGEEEIEAKAEEDPYFVRDAAGRRAKKIPDIARFLAAPPAAGEAAGP